MMIRFLSPDKSPFTKLVMTTEALSFLSSPLYLVHQYYMSHKLVNIKYFKIKIYFFRIYINDLVGDSELEYLSVKFLVKLI